MQLLRSEEILARLHPGLQRWVRQEAQWSALSAIQQAAIPTILAGEDCVIEAPTGGGKTEAVLFPVLTRFATAAGVGVKILYLAPLKALLNNLQSRGEEYAALCDLRAFKWHGDVGQKEKIEALSDPPDLLMTTPESLEAILLRKPGWRRFFAELGAVIIDEAHNFAAGDRGGHLLCLLERVTERTRRPPQRIALSATLGNPEAMLRWLAGPRRPAGRRVAVEAPPREDGDFRIFYFDDTGETTATAPEERAAYRSFATLQGLLAGTAGSLQRSLVFVRSRKSAEALAKGFVEANAHLPRGRRLQVRTHHSAVSKFFREEAERLIQVASEDGLHAIISTSTLELGIDIGELSLVVQMDALASSSSFLQRVGRTGRRPGRPQLFRGLVTDPEDLLLLTAAVSLGRAGRCEALIPPRRAFHLLAHQLLCLALQSFGITPERAWEALKGADCFSGIAQGELDLLVDHMVREDYLRRTDGHLVVGEKAEGTFLHSNWRRLFAVFDSAPLYEVIHQRQQVGTLDAKFVEAIEAPFFFILGGKLWCGDRIDPERRVVEASPSREGTAPAWKTFGGPGVPYETAQEAGRLLHEETPPPFLDDAAQRVFRSLQHQAAGDHWAPGRIALHVAQEGSAHLTTFAGDRINRTLARVLDLAGVGQAVASFQEVELKKVKEDPDTLADAIGDVFADLRQGLWSDTRSLSGALEATQPLWPFSSFAKCLPGTLWASALVEQSLDPEGLLRLVSAAGES